MRLFLLFMALLASGSRLTERTPVLWAPPSHIGPLWSPRVPEQSSRARPLRRPFILPKKLKASQRLVMLSFPAQDADFTVYQCDTLGDSWQVCTNAATNQVVVPVGAGGRFFTTVAHARAKVSLAWDPSTSPYVAGYKAYLRSGTLAARYLKGGNGNGNGHQPASRTPRFLGHSDAWQVDVGPALMATLPGLKAGTTYYFAVTAYDHFGIESDFSNWVTYTAPSNSTLVLTTITSLPTMLIPAADRP